jgi:formate hydrogenlyase subunit 3/multisubunit Na+/H+ antiporter MnhD subunit
MRIKSNTILSGVLILLGIIIFVGGLRYTFDIIVNPPRDNTDTFAIGGAIAICLGLAPLIYGIVSLHDDILHRKEKEEDEERKV